MARRRAVAVRNLTWSGNKITVTTDQTKQRQPQRFRPYPAYKASDVKWLDEIPSHWNARRLKSVASVHLSNVDKHSREDHAPVKLCNYVDVYYNDRITEQIEFMESTASPDQARRFGLESGDVLVTKDSESWNDIAVPAVVAEDLTGVVCGYHLAHIKPGLALDGRFLARQFAAIGAQDQFHVAAKGITRFGLGGDAIRTGIFLLPPIEEQRSIADFLDRETARIDALVERKERLIELLKEKRGALITRAVTRGLDPNVPMKDSSVEWLGEIPAIWDVKRIKWVARMESGHTPDKKVEDYWDGDVPWVSLNDTQHLRDHDFISDTAYYTNERGLENSSARLLPPRSVIFSRDATIGLCAITERAMAVSQHFIAWLCGNDISPEYLLRVFDAMWDELQRLTAGATLRTIGMPDVRTLTTPVPPVGEQKTIVQHIQQKCIAVDQATAKIRHAITLLKESRTALVSAAVTGKIDVRNEAP